MKASSVFAHNAYLKIQWFGTDLPKLEQEFEELLAKHNLELSGSGYNVKRRERELMFRPPLPEVQQEATDGSQEE